MTWLSKFASTVVEGASLEVLSKTGRWIAEVDISNMSKIFATPRMSDQLTVSELEEELAHACGQLVASKLVALRNICGSLAQMPGDLQTLPFPDNAIFASVKEALKTPKEETKTSVKPSTVVEALQPKAVTLDRDGKVTPTHTVYHKPVPETETLAWDAFVAKQHENDLLKQAQALLRKLFALQKSASKMPPRFC